MKRVLAGDAINTGRQIELDVARGLAVLFMIMVHLMEYLSNEAVQTSLFGETVFFLGGIPAAPVFMFLMGIGVVYSQKSQPVFFIKRGIAILIAGYSLNILRGFLPGLAQWQLTGDDYYYYLAIDNLIYIDILQFAGLSLIFFGFLKLFTSKTTVTSLSISAFCIINLLVINIEAENYTLAALTGLFWGSSEYSYFPFLSWIFYPLAGFLYGSLLIRCADKKRFYVMSFVSAFPLMLMCGFIFEFIFSIDYGMLDNYNYYHHHLAGNIVFTAFVISWISMMFFVFRNVTGFVYQILSRWSKNITEIYFIHWILIGWLVVGTGYNTLDIYAYLMIVIIITTCSDLLAFIYNKR